MNYYPVADRQADARTESYAYEPTVQYAQVRSIRGGWFYWKGGAIRDLTVYMNFTDSAVFTNRLSHHHDKEIVLQAMLSRVHGWQNN